MIWSGLVIGILFGFIIQRGRFCTVALVRESTLRRPIALYMVAIIMAIHTLGVHLLTNYGLIKAEAAFFQPISAVLGGLLFGAGMMFAGFCPATIWVRSGEGILSAWVALGSFMLGVEAIKKGPFKSIYNNLRDYELDQLFVYETLGVSAWWFVIGFVSLCAVLVFMALRKPAPKVFTMPAKHSGLRKLLFETRWHPAVTATLMGLLMVVAWYFAEASGRGSGVAFAGPSGNIISFMITSKPVLHWGMLFVFGVMVGGFLASKGAGEFRWRSSDPKAAIKAATGGFAMGLGAALASGCIISHCLINASLFAWQGVIAGFSIILAASVTALFLYGRKN